MSPEELFPPRPGGMVESVRNERARNAATDVPVSTQPGYEAVRVQTAHAEIMSANTIVISTGTNASWQLLGADENRTRAVIMTLDEPIVIAHNRASSDDSRNANAGTAGSSAGGFVLPVNTPVELKHSGEVWVAATSSTATRVSVLAELYADATA